MHCCALLFLLAHFGVSALTVGPLTVTLSQLYAHFLSLAHSIFPTSVLAPPLTFPEKKSVYSVRKSSDDSPLIIIFQVSSGVHMAIT